MIPRIWRHPRTALAARLILGLVMAAAALPKLLDPPALAQAIHAYRLLPLAWVNPAALLLPWLELLLALALLGGFWLRAAALWTLGLMVAFILALSLNLVRGNPVDCGCFGSGAPQSLEARLVEMRWAILRDVGLVLLALRLSRERPSTDEHR